MIYTVTLNPAIDYYLYLDKEPAKGINRTDHYEFVAAGKGVNVSRVLATLKKENVCVVAAGGFSGRFICEETAENKLIEVRSVPVGGNSRINVKIRCAGQEMDLNTSGPAVDKNTASGLIEAFKDLKKDDIVCFSGSLQKGADELLKETVRFLKSKKARVILDVPNLTLEDILELKPYLIKPNKEELLKLLDLENEEDMLEKAEECIAKKGIRVILSVGSEGIWYLDESVTTQIKVPSVKIINTVAAGDSLLAGFIYGLSEDHKLEECLSLAAACGTASVESEKLPAIETIKAVLATIK